MQQYKNVLGQTSAVKLCDTKLTDWIGWRETLEMRQQAARLSEDRNRKTEKWMRRNCQTQPAFEEKF